MSWNIQTSQFLIQFFLKNVEKILTKEQALQINEPRFFRQYICKCELLISLFLLHQNVCVN